MWPLIALAAGQALVNYFQGRSQKKAAEKSSEQLQQGVREARAYAEPLYADAQRIALQQLQQGQAGFAPYAGGGAQGMTALTALLGLPSAPMASAPAAAPPAATPMASPASVPLSSLAGTQNALVAGLTTQQLADANRATGGRLIGMTAGPAAPATQSSYVSLRAPTGDVRPVPADQVDFYLARGAMRV